jgi:hypothetical protein
MPSAPWKSHCETSFNSALPKTIVIPIHLAQAADYRFCLGTWNLSTGKTLDLSNLSQYKRLFRTGTTRFNQMPIPVRSMREMKTASCATWFPQTQDSLGHCSIPGNKAAAPQSCRRPMDACLVPILERLVLVSTDQFIDIHGGFNATVFNEYPSRTVSV